MPQPTPLRKTLAVSTNTVNYTSQSRPCAATAAFACTPFASLAAQRAAPLAVAPVRVHALALTGRHCRYRPGDGDMVRRAAELFAQTAYGELQLIRLNPVVGRLLIERLGV